ncbi:MAG: CRISPR-associated endonuclease Cas6 [Nitrospiraceae bacterium]|nr:CRISPR-associated endonuclease Cas6 [Nitrospiraceae bacterium]
MKLRSYKLILKTDKPINTYAFSLRGFIGRQFPQLELLHNHSTDNTCIYIFPRVQYHILNGHAMIIGIEEGVDAVKLIESSLLQLSMQREVYKVIEKDGIESEIDYGITGLKEYSFLTPWLALNEKNYEKYQRMGTWAERKELLESVLIGNIISMSKSLGYTVSEPIKATMGQMKEVPTKLKGTPMLGFLGTFSVNFEIPDYWGIGKSVSRGFGTIRRCR